MENEKKATETIVPPIATEEKVTLPPTEDMEAKVAALEAEKATILEREANYKMAYLKEATKNREPNPDESDEDRIRRITREELSQSKLSQIDTEKEHLLKRLATENKELKLAQLNKTDIPASTTTHSEGQKVQDNVVSPEDIAKFKQMGKDDKWIENYKKNLKRYR
jgi:hypothetical protein